MTGEWQNMLEQTKYKLPVRPVVSRRPARLGQAVADAARARFVMDAVALATGVPAADIHRATRGHACAARARQIAMYLTYVAWQWPLVRVGAAFDRDRTTVSYACRLIEDLRDDDAFDAQLERLEQCLRTAPDAGRTRLMAPDLSTMKDTVRLPAGDGL